MQRPITDISQMTAEIEKFGLCRITGNKTRANWPQRLRLQAAWHPSLLGGGSDPGLQDRLSRTNGLRARFANGSAGIMRFVLSAWMLGWLR
jgi:hypothetical protein